MNLSKTSIDTNRVRLPSRDVSVSKVKSLNSVIGYVVSFITIVAGVAILLVGMQIIAGGSIKVHAPYWTIILFGVIFIASGLILWAKIQRELRMDNQRQALADQHPHAEALYDYPWDPQGLTKSTTKPALNALGANALFILFLLPFNWWAWCTGETAWVVKIVVSMFNIALLLTLTEMGRLLLVARKYGASGIKYDQFPALTGERTDLRWVAPSGLDKANRITFVLRCVEEWAETTGTGRDRRVSLIHEQTWAATKTAEGDVRCYPGTTIPLSFDLPAAEPGSDLSDKDLGIFWELEVFVEAPGVDFQEHYLVPVYSVED